MPEPIPLRRDQQTNLEMLARTPSQRIGAVRTWLQTALLRELLDYWIGRRGDRSMPARPDIDPVDMRNLLGWLILIDRPEQRFRYRLVGTAICEISRIDITGQSVGSYPDPQMARMVHENCLQICQTLQPAACRYRQTLNGTTVTLERLELPLGAADDRVDMILVGLVPLTEPGV